MKLLAWRRARAHAVCHLNYRPKLGELDARLPLRRCAAREDRKWDLHKSAVIARPYGANAAAGVSFIVRARGRYGRGTRRLSYWGRLKGLPVNASSADYRSGRRFILCDLICSGNLLATPLAIIDAGALDAFTGSRWTKLPADKVRSPWL